MANLAKIKRRNNLGAPPSLDEASQNLTASEIVPVVETPVTRAGQVKTRIDGRTLRKTYRTVQFATKVTAEFDAKFREIAEREGLEFCVLLEKCLEAYEANK